MDGGDQTAGNLLSQRICMFLDKKCMFIQIFPSRGTIDVGVGVNKIVGGSAFIAKVPRFLPVKDTKQLKLTAKATVSPARLSTARTEG